MPIILTEHQDYSSEALGIYQQIDEVYLGFAGCPAEDATYLVVRLNHMFDRQSLSRFPKLRAIVTPTTGINHIDTDFCVSRGIDVLSLKGERNFLETLSATAELAFGFIFVLLRNVVPAAQSVLDGHWDRDAFRGHELQGKTLGIIGLGRLGEKVARYAQAFGMNVLAYDPHLTSIPPSPLLVGSLDELLARSDVISVHADYRPENQYMLCRANLSLVKRGSILINTARGELIDEAALIEALQSGQLAAAAIDVLDGENRFIQGQGNPLVAYARENGNLIISPHLGGCTYESMQAAEVFMAKKALKYHRGEKVLLTRA